MACILSLAVLLQMVFVTGSVVQRNNMSLPLVINTWPWTSATLAAWKVLTANGSGIDAVVGGCSNAEADPSISSVGWGGSPNEDGETTLDAMVMDGVSHKVGAVACMKRIKNAIAVARAVLQHSEHTFLVGEDATRFAKAMGFEEEDLHSNQSIADWEAWKANNCQPNFWRNVSPDASRYCGPYKPLSKADAIESSSKMLDENNHDTIGMIVVDREQNIVVGTSTNGAKFKISGRVGDSSIAGAGAYVDNDVGASAATGDGDIMMRFLPCYQTVENMRNGMSPTEAATDALKRIIKYHSKFQGAVIAASKDGTYGAASYGWAFSFSVINEKLGQVLVVPVQPIPS